MISLLTALSGEQNGCRICVMVQVNYTYVHWPSYLPFRFHLKCSFCSCNQEAYWSGEIRPGGGTIISSLTDTYFSISWKHCWHNMSPSYVWTASLRRRPHSAQRRSSLDSVIGVALPSFPACESYRNSSRHNIKVETKTYKRLVWSWDCTLLTHILP